MQKRARLLAVLAVAAMAIGCAAAPMDPGDPALGAGGTAGGGASGGGSSSTGTGSSALSDPTPTVLPSGGTGGASLPGGGDGTGGTISSAGGVTGTSTCGGQPVSWQTSTVSLRADEFWIVANGQCYTSSAALVAVHSDPGWSQYTTLELVWTELGREMRLFIYLHADAAGWWSDEMRTYDGQQPYSDWLYYYGRFFSSPIGQAFHGDMDLTNDTQDSIRGELHLRGLTLTTTMSGR